MDLLGNLRELVALVFKRDNQDVTLKPNDATTYTAAREVQLPEGDAAHTLVGRDSTDTLENKTIDANSNTISNLEHGAEVDDPSSDVHGVGPGNDVVGTGTAQTLENKLLSEANVPDTLEFDEVAAGSVTTPAANKNRIFFDTTDGQPKYKDDTGTINGFAGAGSVPTGSVMPFAGSSLPTGYLECDGSEVDRTTFAALFAVIGTTFGVGDGSTTFNLPDLRARYIRGEDAANSQGLGAKNLGDAEADATAANGLSVSISKSQWNSNQSNPGNHDHNYDRPSFAASGASGSVRLVFNNFASTATHSNAGSHTHTWSGTASGSVSGDSETRPLSLTLKQIIKT